MNQPVNESTVFDLQSITKALSTAMIAISLSNQGKLNLNSSIDKYIPKEVPQDLKGKGITFKHLLCHSSGLSDSSLEGTFNSAFEVWRQMFSASLNFQPGASIEYSDLGYRILGKLIELETNENLENLFSKLILSKIDLRNLSYLIKNPFNVAGTPDVHGIIDDEQVHMLGGVLGCDGLFGDALTTYSLISEILKSDSNFSNVLSTLYSNVVVGAPGTNFFESLASGSKTFGWELNSAEASYAGKFYSKSCFEKAGGAGTFIWFDSDTKDIFIYLTNHGKPKPFSEESWNNLVRKVAPHDLSNLIYENRQLSNASPSQK